MPLDTIRVKPIAERLRALGGSTKLVLDVITVDERSDEPSMNLLACHVISKAGLMTGGSSPSDRARAGKWNQKEHERLKAEAIGAARELEALGLEPSMNVP